MLEITVIAILMMLMWLVTADILARQDRLGRWPYTREKQPEVKVNHKRPPQGLSTAELLQRGAFKMLPLEFPFTKPRSFWYDCVGHQQREPVFHRNGYFLNRYTGETWLEIDGEAWEYENRLAFEYALAVSEGNNWLEAHVMSAIKTLMDNRLADNFLKVAYWVQNDRTATRQTYREAALSSFKITRSLRNVQASLDARKVVPSSN